MAPRVLVRAWIACVALLGALVWSASPAMAWVELTVSNDDVRVSIDPTGKARVEHRVTLLVSGGPLREVTLQGVDADAAPLPDGYVVLEKDADKKGLDGALPIQAERVAVPAGDGPARTDLKVTLAPGEGIKRGAFVLFVRYETDLRAQGALVDDGATTMLRWTGPAWSDGLDATKAVFELPSAPTEPKVPESKEEDDALDVGTVLSTVHRDGKNDVVELARPYAAKGERVTWSLRVDARAFGGGAKASPSPKQAAGPSRALRAGVFGNPRDSLALGLGLGLFALFSLLVAAKTLEVRRLARERDARESPLVPLPLAARAPLAGLAFVGGSFVEMTHRSSLPGALLVAAAALLAAHRAPRHRAKLRGPGNWLPVSVAEALRSAPSARSAYLDASTWAGRGILALLLGAVGACSALLWPTSRYYAVLVALDATPLLAIFFTGRLDELAPDLAVAPVAFFRKVVRLVERAHPGVRVVPKVRVPSGSADADELRITFLPTRPARGLFAIELGVSYAQALGGHAMFPELLLRYQASSEAEAKAQALAHHGRATRGRRPDESVLSVSPKLPSARMTADLAVALLRAMTGAERPSAHDAKGDRGPTARTKRVLAA